ncbi:MAG TPA: EAL domain-containing protein [Methylophaga aminisulfidivorans]|uniref:EAL domain-containing protein n=1 Tax=Methylophaga TaxID=40222 RepID=UPI0017746C9E|nr:MULTISPECIES: EAL domain-containing protein [Methylophaga]HIC47039.1 EAL domain-containing protein [Methylophaga sp.]HIM39571.1 EAL domain-containing protein [Methylophaga aminisulfidivorans]
MGLERKILIVDDDPIIILELSTVLKNLGDIYVANSGASAIATAKDIMPDIILLDIGLPDIDGFNVLTELSNNEQLRHINVIIVTAHGEFDNHLKSLSSGAVDFISKPVNKHLLEKKIGSMLNNRSNITTIIQSKTQSQLEQLKNQFVHLLSMITEAIIITDVEGNIKLANDYSQALFACNDLTNKNIRDIIPAEQLPHHKEPSTATIQNDFTPIFKQMELKKQDGQIIEVELGVSLHKNGQDYHFLYVIRDQFEKKLTQARLLKAALYDSLTGVYSREALELDLEKTYGKKSNNARYIGCLLDIDRFNELNAVYGHAHCNQLLIAVANELKKLMQVLPVRIYRVGGDLFIIKSIQPIEKINYSSMKEAFQDAFSILLDSLSQQLKHKLSISAVMSFFESDIVKNGAILPMLEDALKNYKQAGKSGELIFVENTNYGRTVKVAALAQSMLSGLDYSKLSVVYQPKINASDEIDSAEALLRWNNLNSEPLRLLDFIGVAESTGVIVDVGYYVLKQVCAMIKTLRQQVAGFDKKISVNLSIRQLADPKLVETFEAICKQHNISPRQIIFEITESVMAENINLLTSVIHALKTTGFGIAIDDFGTGQSNLSYLSQLPIDELKIDKSFVDKINSEEGEYPIVDTVISMAKAMKLKVVAEGVETITQANYLRSKSCDLIQGYYFYKPMPRDEWLKLVTDDS